MKILRGLCVIVFLFSSAITLAQDVTITGKVTGESDDLPIPGVNILIEGSAKGTITNFNGIYTIEAKKGQVLLFSYTGFKIQKITIGDETQINVTLENDLAQLDEIVVIGYGTQKKKNLTGSVSKVKNENLDEIPVARVDEALIGKVSGVNIQNTQGEAGTAPTIQIRGVGSISGDTGPAIVIDGQIVDSGFLTNLDMNEVESFEILKDASSAAIYGSRGANGVILITTKTGKSGKTIFSYNNFIGFKEGLQNDILSTTVNDWARREMAATGMLSERTQYKQLIGVDTPWQDRVLNGGMIQSHSFSASGGNDNTKFRTSLNYLHDEGVLLTDDFKKYNYRVRFDTKLNKKFRIWADLAPSYSETRRFDGSTHDVLRQPAWLPLYHDDNTIQFLDRNLFPNVQVGDYATQMHFDNYDLFGDGSSLVDISTTNNTNPGARVLERDRNDYRFKIRGNVAAEYKFTKDLKFKARFAGDFQSRKRDRWTGVEATRLGPAGSSLEISNENSFHFQNDNVFTYDKRIGKHDINAVAGLSLETYSTKFESTQGTGYTSDVFQTLTAAPVIANAFSEAYESRIFSLFGRINYNYDDKYLASVSFRRDGFSAFGVNNKFGTFPAASVGWVLSEENFLNESKVVNFLKLRVSYGSTGNFSIVTTGTRNRQLESYPFLSLLGPTSAVFGDIVTPAFNPLNISDPNLQWEGSVEFNPALDFGLFNNRISGSFDFYRRVSDQMILDLPVSSTTGFSSVITNRGEVQNQGFEIELRTKNVNKPNVRWSTTFIASRNENELFDFGESNGQISNVDTKRPAEWINLQGNPISSFYGFVVDTDIPAEFINDPWERLGQTNREVIVKDLNGDGLIDDDDKTILGDPYPDLIWSITNNFKIHNFDMSFMFQGSHGAEVRNIADQYVFRHFGGSSTVTNPLDLVSAGIIPNETFIREKIFTNSIVQNASYVALRTVSLGYTIPDKVISDFFITKARVYLSGQNLMYIMADGYTGLNPEAIRRTSPTTFGYQRLGSPINQTVTLGVNIEF
jgi:TonB-linked SusC/RagA family outer membrane protein